MKKIVITAIVCFGLVSVSFSQSHSSTIKQKAMQMANALSSFKLDEYVTFLHPSLVAAQGGNQKIKASQDSINKYQQMFGVKISKILIGEVSAIQKLKKSWQATFPMTTNVQTPMGAMLTETTVVAISEDQGKNWYFIDGLFYNNQSTKSKLPALSPKIIIPPFKKPSLQVPKS